jgi:hypothetical protein
MKKRRFWSKDFAIKNCAEMFQKKIHDHINELSNDVYFSYSYEDYQLYENV